MFNKVLIAEDLDSVNRAVADMLHDLGVKEIENTQYCDQAFLKCKKAAIDDKPVQLLICDLSFKKDHRLEQIKNGEELILKLKETLPEIKIIVHSIEDHPNTVRRLWDSGNIDSYVCKDRNGMANLKEAICSIAEGKKYLPSSIKEVLKKGTIFEIADYEVQLLKLLAAGFTQDEIHRKFKSDGVYPYSKSSIEKKLKDLKEEFGARTNPHLVSMAKDLRII